MTEKNENWVEGAVNQSLKDVDITFFWYDVANTLDQDYLLGNQVSMKDIAEFIREKHNCTDVDIISIDTNR